jgi:hypothetical protein
MTITDISIEFTRTHRSQFLGDHVPWLGMLVREEEVKQHRNHDQVEEARI